MRPDHPDHRKLLEIDDHLAGWLKRYYGEVPAEIVLAALAYRLGQGIAQADDPDALLEELVATLRAQIAAQRLAPPPEDR